MHGFTNFLSKHSREAIPPLQKDDSADSWHSSISSIDSRASSQNEGAGKSISINQRSSYNQRSHRGSSGSPFELASSPRDRYPNFASYFREVIESRSAPSQQQYHSHHADYGRRHESERYQIGNNTYQSPRNDYRHFVSPLYNDAMDDIQECEYSKCERYGDISNTKVGHTPYKNKLDNKSFAQKLTECASSAKEKEQHSNERHGSDSSSSGHRHKPHSIQELIRTFSKRVGHWRHDSGEGRRGSCANPVISAEIRPAGSEEFRSRSKSLDCDQLHKNSQRAHLRRAASQEAEKRRSSLGNVPTNRHRASDAFLDPHHAAMLFRDSRGLPMTDPFLEKVNLSDLDNPALVRAEDDDSVYSIELIKEFETVGRAWKAFLADWLLQGPLVCVTRLRIKEEDESQIFVKFFKFHKCYDLIPTSAKLVVFDTQLLVKKAFFALVYNGVRAAPLWDSQRQKFVGMLTITDFIKILQMYYTSPNGSVMPLVSIGPDSSLYEAIRILITNRIHRLPVIEPETGNINELPKPAYLQHKLRDLRIGTLSDIETATEESSILEALRKFVNRRVSALPLIDAEGRLKDIYAKFDVINLAAEKTYNNLDVSLKKANEHRNEWFEGVQKCTLDETLFNVMERIVRAEDKVIGIISLSDLLMYLVLRPTGECGGASLRNEHGPIEESDELAGSGDEPAGSGDEPTGSGLLK
ncbi:AMP-activated protein kinase gamma subunit [Operophtera brumata]|uniref:AMP-activated protein kinase gamma subunit n=1 Tax=Operophtera brumata TaxID=104452 RepID=A0A0L7LPW6_OPEBR|nr:AMP-activated protein kinase gamma subunit [Operophtera brumata]